MHNVPYTLNSHKPWTKKWGLDSTSEGILGEIDFNLELMKDEEKRRCLILSTRKDRGSLFIQKLVNELYVRLKSPELPVLDKIKRELFENPEEIIDKNPDEVRIICEQKGLPNTYDFDGTPSSWKGQMLRQKDMRQKQGFREIHSKFTDDILELVENADMKDRTRLMELDDGDFWSEGKRVIKENL